MIITIYREEVHLMKTSCRILSVVLMVMMLMSLSANAFAADAQYQVTKDFVNMVKDVNGITCEVAKTVSDSTGNYELVYVTYDGELFPPMMDLLYHLCNAFCGGRIGSSVIHVQSHHFQRREAAGCVESGE